jgi:hypothetical protein
VKRKREKVAMEDARKKKEAARKASNSCGAAAEVSDSDSASPTKSSSSEFEGASPPKRKRPINIISAELASSLDRTKTTDRMAVHTIAAISRAHGVNPEELALNKWTIKRRKHAHRIQVMEDLQEQFAQTVVGPIVVHWDGKLMADYTGTWAHEKVDRLAVVVSNSSQEQLLNIAKLPSGSGQAIADAVVTSLDNWHLTNQVKAMSFDTTPVTREFVEVQQS